MFIGVDASRSIDTIQKTGVEKVSDELIKNLLLLENEFSVEFVFYAPKLITWLPKDKQKIIKLKKFWTVLGLSWQMLWRKPDMLFIPVHTLPFFCPPKTFKIIHDIAFKKNPHSYSFWQKIYLNFDLKRCVKKCEKIFVPTNQVKNDLLKYTSADKDKITVIGYGYKKQKNVAIGEYKNKKKQILYIGRIEDKKNILNLVRAFKIFLQKFPDYRLILAGKPGVGYHQIQQQINGLNQYKPNAVQMLGYINEKKKYQLLSQSVCLVLVSREEGFGFPLLEGFDFGLPVVCSNIPVLREVGGEACVFVEPNSPRAISKGLEKIIKNKTLRQEMISRGQRRLEGFSWQKTARKILAQIAGND